MEAKDVFIIMMLGMMVGGFLGYTIAKPVTVAEKFREIREAF